MCCLLYQVQQAAPLHRLFVRRALHILSGACSSDEGQIANDKLAARQHADRSSGYSHSFKRIIVYIHMMRRFRNDPLDRRIENHDVGIATYRNRALAWKQPEQLRAARRNQIDKLVQR